MSFDLLAVQPSETQPTHTFCEQPLTTSNFWANAGYQRGQYSMRLHAAGADPWATAVDGKIYYTHTTGRDIRLWVVDSLEELSTFEPLVIWRPDKKQKDLSKNIWAPEIHYVNGNWYIYFAADDGRNHNHRMYVLESLTGPLGPYNLRGKLSVPGHDRWAIDGTVVEIDHQLYFSWSGWPGKKNGRQNLYLSRMSNPWTLEGEPTLISTPQYSWESWINEAPQFIQRHGKIFVVYSANRSWTDEYQLGMLMLDGSDPLAPHSWRKLSIPVFQSVTHGSEKIYGPGHCSFCVDGSDRDWIVYHVAKRKGSGWKREVRAQEWHFGREGTPYFGRPLPVLDTAKLTQLVMPSGLNVEAA